MMRSLYTAVTGMKSQQLNIDTIANNLANVNTTGFKKQRIEFKDLFYEKLNRSDVVNGIGRPVNLEIGHGVKAIATTRNFTNGNFEHTGNQLDLAIEGPAFFVVLDSFGNEYFTRDGSFKLSIDGDQATLVTALGYPVMDENNMEIMLDNELSDFAISSAGLLTGLNPDGESVELGIIRTVRIPNPAGLESIGRNLYRQTEASGFPADEVEDKSYIMQGYLETSNVAVIEEMVNMITAQKAYEMSSKVIQTSDEMLGLANNLRR